MSDHEYEIVWVGEKAVDCRFANTIFELPSDDISLIGFSMGSALAGKHTVLDLPSIYSLSEVIHHINMHDFRCVHPIHSLQYKEAQFTNEPHQSMDQNPSEFPLSLVVRIPMSNADNIAPVLEQVANSETCFAEVWMVQELSLLTKITEQRSKHPRIVLQVQPTLGESEESLVGDPVLYRQISLDSLSHHTLQTGTPKQVAPKQVEQKQVEQKQVVLSIFTSASALVLCQNILQDIGDEILQKLGWRTEQYTFELILIHRIQPLPEEMIAGKLSDSGRAIFVDIPSSAYKHCIKSAFWRLESPPQQLFIGHLSYQKAKTALYRSLYALLEQ